MMTRLQAGVFKEQHEDSRRGRRREKKTERVGLTG